MKFNPDKCNKQYLDLINKDRKSKGLSKITLKELLFVLKNGNYKKQLHSNHTGYIKFDTNNVCENCGYPIIILLNENKYVPNFGKNIKYIAYCSNINCSNHKIHRIKRGENIKFSVNIKNYMYQIYNLNDSVAKYKELGRLDK